MCIRDRDREPKTTLYGVHGLADEIRAYVLTTGARDSAKDIDPAAITGNVNVNPRGVWGDGTTLWVADYWDNKLYAYTLSDGSRTEDDSRDIDLLAGAAGTESTLDKSGVDMFVARNGILKIRSLETSGSIRTAAVAVLDGMPDAVALDESNTEINILIIDVDRLRALSNDDRIIIGQEIMIFRALDDAASPPNITVTRSERGTQAESHNSGAPIYILEDIAAAVAYAYVPENRKATSELNTEDIDLSLIHI